MRIPLQVIVPLHTMKVVDTHALINSRADISCLDYQFACKHRLPLTKLQTPVLIRNADLSENKRGPIRHTCHLFINIEGIAHKVTFHLMAYGKANLILKLPWLKTINPTIDWQIKTIAISESTNQSKRLYEFHTHDTLWHDRTPPKSRMPSPPPRETMVHQVMDYHLFSYLHHEGENQFMEHALDNRAIFCLLRCGNWFIPNHSPIIAKLTTAIELAAMAEKSKPKTTLPQEYEQFAPVFSKEATASMPPSQPYDHEINLDDTFTPKIGKLYPLSPDEWQATEIFIDEHLASGKIQPSNSPQASLFFFVKKKDGGLCPCQDYHYVNKHTICDAYPLPLILDLIDKLQGAKMFTKFNIQWGYNNVRIKDGHQWKATFVTHRGLFKPTVMFFGLCNSPTTFQHFMNNSFRDMIAEGWLVIYMDDLLVFSPDKKTHTECTKRVLQRMMDLDLHLKLEKCTFTATEVEYLRMIVHLGQLAMDPVKLDGIAKWPTLTKVKDVWSFLGFANFYRRFIPNYSNVARPLIDLTKKNTLWLWTATHDTAFS